MSATSNEQREIRLIIAEDHTLLRQGMRHLLTTHNPHFTIQAEVGNGQELLDCVAIHHPDVVLVDVNMPVMNGIDATRALRAANIGCKVLILTGYEDPNLYEMAMEAGAHGYILKSAGQEDLAKAIHAVLEGETYVGRELAEAAQRENAQRKLLTRREREVLELVVKGLKSKDIAEMLFISVKTVEKHRSNILHKTGVNSVAQLMSWARSAGLTVETDSPLSKTTD